MKTISTKSFYILSSGIILVLSMYPLIMGAELLTAYIRDGYVDAAQYPKYVIPYTPISIALILSVALLPLSIKLFKKYALLAISAFGTIAFLLSEILFETVTVFDGNAITGVGSWQAALCIATPEVLNSLTYKQTIGSELSERYSPIFKVHFYLIAILIVLAVIGIVYGFSKMIRERCYDKTKPLVVQTASVAVFIGLCIFACFTAFYRTGEINISARSSWLMSVFFIVFGVTAGAYSGGLLYGKKPLISRLLPAIIAAVTTIAMYIGELVLMGGVLFKFGIGFIFEPIFGSPFAIVDFVVIIISGLITYGILFTIRRKEA